MFLLLRIIETNLKMYKNAAKSVCSGFIPSQKRCKICDRILARQNRNGYCIKHRELNPRRKQRKKSRMSLAKQIKPAFEWIESNNKKHLDGIINRKNGSFWNGDFVWQDIVNCFWQVLPRKQYKKYLHKEECEYLYLDLINYPAPEFLKGYQNIRSLKDFSREELESVSLEQGQHGIELRSDLVFPQKANIVWLILGDTPDKSQKTVWTCHPGNPTMSIKHIPKEWEWYGNVLDLWLLAKEYDIDFAVKGIVNGI